MPRHSQDDLYKLVRGLTSAEKGYVRRFFSRYSDEADQAYIELFDLLNEMEQFNADEYRSLISTRPWARRSAAVKAYCMSRVLEALRSYHSSSTPARQLNELLDDADNLLDHGLYDEAEKRALKARTSAEEQEAFLPLLRSLAWLKRYRQLVRNDYDAQGTEEDLGAEQQRVLALYENTLAYEEVGNSMHRHILRSGTGNAASTRWMNTIINEELLAHPAKALSLSARVNRHLIRCNWYRMFKDDTANAFKEAAALNTLRESNAPYFTSRAELSETILYTYLSCALEARKPEIFQREADEFYAWSKGARSEREVRRATRSWMLEANHALYERTYERLIGIEPRIRQFHVQQGHQVPPHYLSTLLFTMVRIGYESKLSHLFQFWSQQLMQVDDAVRPDLHAAAMVIELMQAVDDGNLDHVRTRVRGLERYARKHLQVSEQLSRVLSFFRRLPDASPARARQLGTEVLAYLADHATFQMFDPVGTSGIRVWFTSRYGSESSKKASREDK